MRPIDLSGNKIWVAMVEADYEGGTLVGVCSTRRRAEKILEPPDEVWVWQRSPWGSYYRPSNRGVHSYEVSAYIVDGGECL